MHANANLMSFTSAQAISKSSTTKNVFGELTKVEIDNRIMNPDHSVFRRGKKYRLVADIGGINARFALLQSDGKLTHQHTLACAFYSDIVTTIKSYLDIVGNPYIEEAAIAITSHINGDKIKMANHHWTFSIEQTRRSLNLESLIFKNDLTALAMSIPVLPAQELKQVGGVSIQSHMPIAVVAPSTSLGISCLIHANNQWIQLESEAGHVSLSPGNDFEIAILEYSRENFEHVSAEHLISSMGILNLYRAVCSIEGEIPQILSAKEISRLALAGSDRLCELTLSTFCSLLGSITGNLVLTLGAFGGVYIGGGIIPSLGSYFETSPFRTRFEAKGRYQERMHQVPVYVIQSKCPALTGMGYSFNLSNSAN